MPEEVRISRLQKSRFPEKGCFQQSAIISLLICSVFSFFALRGMFFGEQFIAFRAAQLFNVLTKNK